jgi:hypothetical protein
MRAPKGGLCLTRASRKEHNCLPAGLSHESVLGERRCSEGGGNILGILDASVKSVKSDSPHALRTVHSAERLVWRSHLGENSNLGRKLLGIAFHARPGVVEPGDLLRVKHYLLFHFIDCTGTSRHVLDVIIL